MIPKFHNNEKVLCHKKEDTPDTYRVATILDCKDLQGNVQYYVRYPDYNTRLDEWTSENNIVKYSTKYKIIRPHQSEDKSSRMVTRAVRSQNVYMLEKEGEQQGGNGPVVEHETTVRTKNISVVTFGEYDLSTWYFSPYPGKYGTVDHLYICQHCLKYMSKSKTYQQHRNKCQYFFPPGLLIYRDPETKLAFFEVDGAEAKMFCQSLCLLSKLFLDHKTLYYDVEPFYFYVLCTFELNNTTQREEYQIVGYFSKEKASPDGYNLSCLMVLPHCQRKGYGKMLISMSYELSRIEGLPGSPEKPLSDLGMVSFKSYWTATILEELMASQTTLPVQELTLRTGITKEDCFSTLESLQMIKRYRGEQSMHFNRKQLEQNYEKHKLRRPLVKKQYLEWKPHSIAVKDSSAMESLKSYC